MVGHKDKIKLFKKLADNDKLFHAYLFFGEPQLGKFLFAKCLANYLEKKEFEYDGKILEEALIITPNEKGTIGIDITKEITRFLYQKPVFSKKRVVIINDAENFTNEAQNAILKIIEESPESALVIFLAQAEDLLLPALASRLQKIYFSRVSIEEMEKYFKSFQINGKSADIKKIKAAIEGSFGRPGRAIEILNGLKSDMKGVKLDDIIDNGSLDAFFEAIILKLRKDKFRNLAVIKEVLKRLVLIKTFNVNKKLQLKSIMHYLPDILKK